MTYKQQAFSSMVHNTQRAFTTSNYMTKGVAMPRTSPMSNSLLSNSIAEISAHPASQRTKRGRLTTACPALK